VARPPLTAGADVRVSKADVVEARQIAQPDGLESGELEAEEVLEGAGQS